jgi:6-phosphogluconolactonase
MSFPPIFRVTFFCVAPVVAVFLAGGGLPGGAGDSAGPLWVYVGTYTSGSSKGIYRFDLDPASGKLTGPTLAAEAADPSFLAIHPNHRFLYAVAELDKFGGKSSGAVIAFGIDPKTGNLLLLNQQPSGGPGPCYIITDRQGKHVLVANYSGGSVSVLPIAEDGKLGEATAFVQHHGSSVNKERQQGPHAHSINLDAANRFAFVADLGLDKVLVYRFDADRGTLTPNDPPAAEVKPGAGPRHFAFHPNGRYAYVINELDSTVTAFTYDSERGILNPMETLSALPEGFHGQSYCAEVQVHPSGKFLYGSNRGQNSIAIFGIDQETGRLKAIGHQGDQIKTPRGFGMDPGGKCLLVGNQYGDSIVVFRINPETGMLQPTGSVVEVPKPVCVKVLPRPTT